MRSPFVFPTIKVDGKPYYDGGIADPIPIRRSIEDGNDKNLIVLTRPEGYRKEIKQEQQSCGKTSQEKISTFTGTAIKSSYKI